jgi:EmrB/QacA subfamily drug resistance transporter
MSAVSIHMPAASRAKPFVLAAMCLAVLMAQVDTSVVNLAAKSIGADFHSGTATLQWVIDAYNLLYASLLMTAGALGDLYGRRRVFVFGVGVFTCGSLLCGLAPNEILLIGGRGVTGIGAALMLPTSLSILAVTYPEQKQRSHAIALWASCNGLAFAIGPTLGGWIVEAIGWRAIFLMIVPVSATALVLALKFVTESANPEGRHLDLRGQLLAIAALAGITFAAIEGAHLGLTAWLVLVAGAIGVAATLGFLLVERRLASGLMPFALFRHVGLPASMAVASLMTFGMYSMFFLMALYFQNLRGSSVFLTGFELLPMSLTFFLVSQSAGKLSVRFGRSGVMSAGMACMGIGLLLLVQISPQTSLAAIEAAFLLIGAGLGLNTGPVVDAAVASVPPARSGTASGLVNTARMVGATLGVAILGAIYAAFAEGHGDAGMIHGMRWAFAIGAGGELIGAAIAWFAVGQRKNLRD